MRKVSRLRAENGRLSEVPGRLTAEVGVKFPGLPESRYRDLYNDVKQINLRVGAWVRVKDIFLPIFD